MRKKILSVLLMLLFANTLAAQITSLPSSSAFQSTKFSDVNVNESSGKINTSIPLYTYQVGKLSMPISLFYIGNGVKVSQQCNWVGTNWNLNAGGVVTRIVNSYPDEKATSRLFLEDLIAQGTSFDSNSLVRQPNDTRDYQVDLFNFSFPGYSGTFYLDKNFIPRLTDNNTELKIEFVGGFTNSNTNTILITTPEGIKYYFGGVDASENSSTIVRTPKQGGGYMGIQQVNQIVSPIATTAFYLFKVENYYGDQILIEYHDDGAKNYVLNEQHKRDYPINYTYNEGDGCVDSSFTQLRSALYHGTIHNSKKIKRIYSTGNQQEVLFNSDNLVLPSDGVIPTPQYDDRILRSIQIKNTTTNTFMKNVVLDYLTPNNLGLNASRFFLEKVSFNYNALTTDPKCEVYKLEYNNPQALPSRFSYQVDMLGYFNGEANTNLIPKEANVIFDSAFQDLAIRDTNIEFATKGALTKIYYPTGGHTSFEYEQPKARAVIDMEEQLFIYRNVASYIPTTKVSDSFDIGGEIPESPEMPYLTCSQDQVMEVHVKVDVDAGTSHHTDKIIVTVNDLTTSTPQTQEITLNSAYLHYDGVLNFNLIKDHIYVVTLTQNPSQPLASENAFFVHATAFFKGYEYFPALGIRLRTIQDVSENNVKSIKRYFYKKAKDLSTNNDDSAVVTYDPNDITTISELAYGCNVNNFQESFDVVSLQSNPFSNIFGSADNQVEYKFVTISYGGDYFEEGGVEKAFEVEKQKKVADFYVGGLNPNGQEYGSSFDNTNQFNGNLICEKEIIMKNNSLFFKSERSFIYTKSEDHQIKNFIVARTENGIVSASNYIMGDPPVGTYSNFSYKNNLTQVKSKFYTEPVAINSTTSNGVMEFSTVYEYGTLRGLPTSVTVLDSEDKIKKTKYFYPVASDIASLTGLSAPEIAAYTTLETQNTIAEPIQVETYVKEGTNPDKLLFTKRNLFVDNSGKVTPKKEVASKATGPFVGTTEITQVNSKSNAVEITTANQFKKSILYGYNEDIVIAELNNVAYSTIPAATITNLKNLSNAVVDATTMANFETQLNALRTSFPNALITTYVYNEKKQLISVTDARGNKTTNVYDSCNRLKYKKDKDGNVIEEIKYNILNN